MKNHQFMTTLRELRGNTRACVYTEPLWGIPYHLFSPYASVYMLAFGLTDGQIGSLVSIGLMVQMFWTIMGGAITDKLGRKRTTLIFDILAWSVPCLIWAMAQNFTYFLIAVIVNAAWRVPQNSWQCLMVEDAEPELLVDVYSWVYISGLVVAFVSPITGILIGKFTLIPTIRGLYVLAVVMMTSKFLILNVMSTETRQGMIRMDATKHEPLFVILRGLLPVLKHVLSTPATLFTAGVMVIFHIFQTVNGTFWSILVTEKVTIPAQHLPLYHFTRSMTMLIIFFTLMPKLRNMQAHKPLFFGFAGLMLTQVVLLCTPAGNYWILLIATIAEGCSVPVASTLINKLMVITVAPKERARIMAILYAVVIVFTSPFGWIAGQLSEVNRSLPFVMNLVLLSLGAMLSYRAWASGKTL